MASWEASTCNGVILFPPDIFCKKHRMRTSGLLFLPWAAINLELFGVYCWSILNIQAVFEGQRTSVDQKVPRFLVLYIVHFSWIVCNYVQMTWGTSRNRQSPVDWVHHLICLFHRCQTYEWKVRVGARHGTWRSARVFRECYMAVLSTDVSDHRLIPIFAGQLYLRIISSPFHLFGLFPFTRKQAWRCTGNFT